MTPQTRPEQRPEERSQQLSQQRPEQQPAAEENVAAPWLRPHPLTVVSTALSMAVLLGGAMLIAGAAVMFNGSFAIGIPLALSGFAAAAAITAIEWHLVRHTRYRVTEERVESRTRLLAEKHRTIARDRVRSVDVSADIWARLVGLRKVTIGTGQNAATAQGDELKLELVTAAEADRLRRELLRRSPAPAASVAEAAQEVAAAQADLSEAISRMRLGWFGVAPLSIATPALGVGAIGGLYKLVDWFSNEYAARTAVDVYQLLMASALVLIPVAAVAVLVAGAVAATALEVEAWWNYRLDREADGTLRIRRGLLNTKSVSLQPSRLRGVELQQRLLLRRLGFARVKAVATGLGTKEQNETAAKSDLGPDMPVAEAQRIAANVLREDDSPVRSPLLRRHPRAALRRRLTRAVAACAAACAVGGAAVAGAGMLGWDWVPAWVWAAPLALLPFALLYAVDLYRGLGSAPQGRYLLLRRGSLARRTVALRTDGIIGWSVKRSPFQRRAGLATIGATTAAGAGVYRAPDLDLSDGLGMADESVPGLLAPFLRRA
ncbi:putative membrane protein [Murinocardiopsis flavida]|uniref:Putative membrane protein n=1 Tax=Murinocardiopsis flavida TaxID=645275 RepID=A0A2P8DS53_9ACTN|nr:PH domain-containing protein [Murinocardiopsis flavida]PSL00038.1 putative membrane protein [Murinocardiopsis flavida]